MTTVGLIGLGLIGGSLGLDLRSQGLTVFGVSRQVSNCERAIEREIVDRASPELALLTVADVIFICTPIAQIAPTLKALVPYLKPSAIVTDVGSVKAPIVAQCSSLWANFIGGHPMAGTEAQGVEAGQSNLFVDCPYILTPTAQTLPETIEKLANLVRSLGSRLYLCEPAIHDRAVAWISHLPVMISANLIQSCLGEPDPAVKSLAQQLASSGFRDTSRVGGGNPELGLMMAQYNQDALLRSLLAYRDQLEGLIAQIEQGDWHRLNKTLEITQQKRPDYLG
jgi:arogenate dehydrogenase (NADP+)